MPAPRSPLLVCVLLAASFGCGLEHIDAILAKYDTFGSTCGTTLDSTSTSGTDTTGDTDTTTAGDTSDGDTSGNDTGGLAGTTTDDPSASTGDMTTAAPGPVCGDGVVSGDEECDDQNQIESDGCLSDCRRTWTVFVTSEPYTQGDIKGLVGTDYQCRHRATQLFLPGGERYRAWISTSEVHAADRLYHARGPYVLIDGTQIAANWDALLAGPLDHPIDLDELNQPVDALVFTGTTPDGLAVPNSTHCDDWTDNDGDNFTWFGVTTEVNKDWTFAAEQPCGAGAALYCFEQP